MDLDLPGDLNGIKIQWSATGIVGNGVIVNVVDDGSISNDTASAAYDSVSRVVTVKVNYAATTGTNIVAAIHGLADFSSSSIAQDTGSAVWVSEVAAGGVNAAIPETVTLVAPGLNNDVEITAKDNSLEGTIVRYSGGGVAGDVRVFYGQIAAALNLGTSPEGQLRLVAKIAGTGANGYRVNIENDETVTAGAATASFDPVAKTLDVKINATSATPTALEAVRDAISNTTTFDDTFDITVTGSGVAAEVVSGTTANGEDQYYLTITIAPGLTTANEVVAAVDNGVLSPLFDAELAASDLSSGNTGQGVINTPDQISSASSAIINVGGAVNLSQVTAAGSNNIYLVCQVEAVEAELAILGADDASIYDDIQIKAKSTGAAAGASGNDYSIELIVDAGQAASTATAALDGAAKKLTVKISATTTAATVKTAIEAVADSLFVVTTAVDTVGNALVQTVAETDLLTGIVEASNADIKVTAKSGVIAAEYRVIFSVDETLSDNTASASFDAISKLLTVKFNGEVGTALVTGAINAAGTDFTNLFTVNDRDLLTGTGEMQAVAETNLTGGVNATGLELINLPWTRIPAPWLTLKLAPLDLRPEH